MAGASLPPGFRFHPTDEELVEYYLKQKVEGLEIELEVIPVIELYKFDPWELPEKSFLPGRDMEWFFFCPRDRKYPNGSRTNRATKAGYWKATGKDRKITCQSSLTGYRKTLVFYRGRAPCGARTDWVMHEYLLSDDHCQGSPHFQGGFALCRVVKKNVSSSKMSEFNGESKSKKFGNSSINGDLASMQTSNEQPVRFSNELENMPMTRFELPLPATDPSSVWVSPNLILDFSKDIRQGNEGISENDLLHNELQTPMVQWEDSFAVFNEFSPSSTYSNFTEEIGMSPLSGLSNYMGYWGNDDITTYQDYDHNNIFGNPNLF